MSQAIKVDTKGRLMIPQKIRKELNIEPGDTFFLKKKGKILQMAKIENPFDLLAEQAKKERKEGKVKSLEDLAKDWDIDVRDE